MVSLPFSDHCEPLMERPEELEFFVDCLQAEIEHQKWKYLEVRPVNGIFDSGGKQGSFRATEKCYLHRLNLRTEMGDIFRSFHRDSVQHEIRRAERAGLVCERGRSDRLLQDFYSLCVLARNHRDPPPQPYAWFRNLLDSLDNSLEIRVAYKDQMPIAAILILRFRDTIYCKYGCSNLQFKDLGAISLLLWEAIRDSKTAGAEYFDLGRSAVDDQGLIECKNHWAGGHTPMVCWRCSGQDPLAMKDGWKMKAVKYISARMPSKFLALTGKFVYRHIG
jgi:lipid II:glycine glycyltransferase (peptidoglycan interpeptide bridge formation enzyme)